MADRTSFSSSLRLLQSTRAEGVTRDSAADTPPVLDEPSLFYDPPYASRVHDTFAWHLVKYLQCGSGLRYRVTDTTHNSEVDLTVDFVVECGSRRVGFMCGASAAGAAQDRLLDALRIQHAAVDVLYRLRARDIERHLHDVLLLVAKWDASLFSERGRINLHTLASPEARAARPLQNETVATLRYGTATGAQPSASLRLQRLTRTHPEGWMNAYGRARGHFEITDPAPQRWARSA